MKRLKRVKWIAMLLAFGMILSLFPMSAIADNEDAYEIVKFVHTNDIHGYIDVEPYVKPIADKLKAEYGALNVITASGGDVFGGGQAIAHLTKGEAIVEIMNAVGYDVMTLGNADVIIEPAQILKLTTVTNFPILAANYFSKGIDETNELSAAYAYGDQPFDSTTIFFTEKGTKIGVFGITTHIFDPNNDSEKYYSTGTIETAQQCVNKLKAEDCDLIVALIHTGWFDDLVSTSNNDANSYQVAMGVDGIDLMLDAHTHSIINNGLGYSCENDSNTLITQAGSSGNCIGVATVTLNENHQVIDKSAYLLTKEDQYGGVEPDANVLAMVNKWEQAFTEKYGTAISTTSYFLNGERTAASPDGKGIRMAEQNLGNLITDALRFDSGVEIAMFRGVKIRSSIEAGDITLLDLLNVFSTGGTLYSANITGADLREMLESYIASACDGNEASVFRQVSGISFVYDAASKTVVSMTLADGQEITDEGVYSVLNEGAFADGAVMRYSGDDDFAQAVMNYLASSEYDTENYAGTDGRIVELSNLQ